MSYGWATVKAIVLRLSNGNTTIMSRIEPEAPRFSTDEAGRATNVHGRATVLHECTTTAPRKRNGLSRWRHGYSINRPIFEKS